MSPRRKKTRTIVHFGSDRASVLRRACNLNPMGYNVLAAANGFEAIQWGARKTVDAVVLDLDRNHAEIALVATEIKRCRPHVPTILLAEPEAPRGFAHEVADALVTKSDSLEMLIAALEDALVSKRTTSR